MTDAAMKQTRFTISQLRLKNIWRELELLGVLIMVIFVSSLLPSLLLRYVYTDPTMMETPPIFDIIPVFSFVIGVVFFIYVVVGNLMREMTAMRLEKSLETGVVPSMPSSSTTSSDLQAAMKSLSSRTESKRTGKVVAAQRSSSRSTKARTGKRKNK